MRQASKKIIIFILLIVGLHPYVYGQSKRYTFKYRDHQFTYNLSCNIKKIKNPPPLIFSGEEHYDMFMNPAARITHIEKRIFANWAQKGDISLGREGQYRETNLGPGQFPLEEESAYATVTTVELCHQVEKSVQSLRNFEERFVGLNLDDSTALETKIKFLKEVKNYIKGALDPFIEMDRRRDVIPQLDKAIEYVYPQSYPKNLKYNYLTDWPFFKTIHQITFNFMEDLTIEENIKNIKDHYSELVEEGQNANSLCKKIAKQLIGGVPNSHKKIYHQVLRKISSGESTIEDTDKLVVDLRNVIFVEKILQRYCENFNRGTPKPIVTSVGAMHILGMKYIMNLIDPQNRIPVKLRVFGTHNNQMFEKRNSGKVDKNSVHPMFGSNAELNTEFKCFKDQDQNEPKPNLYYLNFILNMQNLLNNISLEKHTMKMNHPYREGYIKQQYNAYLLSMLKDDFIKNPKKFEALYSDGKLLLEQYLKIIRKVKKSFSKINYNNSSFKEKLLE